MKKKQYKKGKHVYTQLDSKMGKGVKEVKKVTETKTTQKQIPIKMDEETAMGKYSNLGMIAHGPEEFTIDFIYMPPGAPGTVQGKVVSRIITSPGHAKRLQMALNENIAKYEAKHGKIEPTKGPEPQILH
jgi:hypothetical protein